MRILYVSNSGTQFLAVVLPALEARGATYRSISTDELDVHRKSLRWLNAGVVRRYHTDRPYLAAFRQAVDEFKPDLVHVTGVRGALLRTLRAMHAFPRIPIVHERVSAGGMNPFSPLDWILFQHKRIDRIVMPSYAMLNNWMGRSYLWHMVRPARCEVQHYAIATVPELDADARRALRRSLGLDEDAFTIGTTCYIRPWKNIEFVAEIVGSFDPQKRICFAVIGDAHGAKNKRYLERVKAIGGPRTRFLGRIPNAARMMGVFDLYVTPTALPGESFGLAFAEAMACGVPSLTMNYGASAELCEHGVSGYALPPNKSTWRSVIEMLMHDVAKRESIGRAARQQMQTLFSPDAVAEEYLALYRRVIAEH
jgi:glycosyltransferase involved in cell wall biosynthesis